MQSLSTYVLPKNCNFVESETTGNEVKDNYLSTLAWIKHLSQCSAKTCQESHCDQVLDRLKSP